MIHQFCLHNPLLFLNFRNATSKIWQGRYV
jgi:hypothetical protein